MTNWQVFKINDVKNFSTCCYGGSTHWVLYLDGYAEFADGYEKEIGISDEMYKSGGMHCGEFIEIDIDRTKFMKYAQRSNGILRKVPKEVAIRRRMERVASADPTALAITREGAERVMRGEISEFEYKMVDNSNNTHHFIYRK